MYTLTITGRKKRIAVFNAAGDPVTEFDTSPMTLEAADEKSAFAEGKFLVHEYHDSPKAIVTLPDKTTMTLGEWLVRAGVLVAPPQATPTVIPAPVVPPVAPRVHGVVSSEK